MNRNVNRVDHVVARVKQDNFENVIQRMSLALQTAFYGPFDRPEQNIRVAVSWDAGIEVITPLSAETEVTEEGWITVLFGVRSLDDVCERLKPFGHEPRARYSGISGVEPWLERFEFLDEAMFEPQVFGGLPMGFIAAEERVYD